MRKPSKSTPLLPPTDVYSCGPRCLSITVQFADQPLSVVLHNVSPGWQLAIAVGLKALST